MKFSYNAVWEDTAALLKANASVIVAIAGVFMFLPALIFSYYIPQSEEAQTLAGMTAYITENWPWLLISNIISMIGNIAILLLLFDRSGMTVGSAIGRAFPLLPFYFLASFLSRIAIMLGLFAFILPGLYLLGRFFVAGTAVVAENRRNPLDAIGRSFNLTRGNGWKVAGLVVIIFLVATLVSFVINAIFGTIFLLVAGERIGGLLAAIVSSATGAVVSAIMVVLMAAIYRRLAPGQSGVRAAD